MKLDNTHIYLFIYLFIYLHTLSHRYHDKMLLKFQVIFIECSKDHNVAKTFFALKLPQYEKIDGYKFKGLKLEFKHIPYNFHFFYTPITMRCLPKYNDGQIKTY